MDPAGSARAVIANPRVFSPEDVRGIADELRRLGQNVLVGRMLASVARRALRGPDVADRRIALAALLRDHQQFGYARRLLRSVRNEGVDSEVLRQQHALCTSKDLELSAGRRFDLALQILNSGGPLDTSTDAETLGIAGSIYKRRWEVTAKLVELRNSFWFYHRGFEQTHHPQRWYAGINAAFVADLLASLEGASRGGQDEAGDLRRQADEIRSDIVRGLTAPVHTGSGDDDGWNDATLGEALFGLGDLQGAKDKLALATSNTQEVWRRETTASQLASLARLRGLTDEAALDVLAATLGGNRAAVDRASFGKVGLALSGGGYRASLYHIGVLARLAECDLLRRIEVLSCVSGGSILGAYYYLKLRGLLQTVPDARITDRHYVDLVREVADEFLNGVQKNLRGRLLLDVPDDVKIMLTKYSLSDKVGEMLEEQFYGPLRDTPGVWRMPDLPITPAGENDAFAVRYGNWARAAKIPLLVLNATTLNTGHSWQFTAWWMGEPPSMLDEQMDASRRLRRVPYDDAPAGGDLRAPTLGKAVAASACVPGLFPPVSFARLYDGVDVELVDGGVHDNQGIASLVEQDCSVILVSDASGQLHDERDPKRWMISVLNRSNSVLMKRVRGTQFGELLGRVRAGTLRGFMGVHLTKGMWARPYDWRDTPDPWEPDEGARGEKGERPSPYGIDRRVQRALAQMRTDLDAFSDDEAYALMAAGYLMTGHDLGDALPTLAVADPDLELGAAWPFWPALIEMTSADASRLARSLQYSDARFLRKPRAWLGWVRGKIPFIR